MDCSECSESCSECGDYNSGDGDHKQTSRSHAHRIPSYDSLAQCVVGEAPITAAELLNNNSLSSPSSTSSPSSSVVVNRSGGLSRKEFRDTIGREFARDVRSGEFSYDEIIQKYRRLYPEYAAKFTKTFCSKVRCGRVLSSGSEARRSVKNGDQRMKRISKVSRQPNVTRLTPELFRRIHEWELQQCEGPVRMADIERIFHVNRSTYTRWKHKYYPQDFSKEKKSRKRSLTVESGITSTNTNANINTNTTATPSLSSSSPTFPSRTPTFSS